jgi:hypothetical protein
MTAFDFSHAGGKIFGASPQARSATKLQNTNMTAGIAAAQGLEASQVMVASLFPSD